MNKSETIKVLEDSRKKFMELIKDLPDEQFLQPGVMDDWSIKDILVHLTMWEAELVKLLWQASRGIIPTTVHLKKIDVDEQNAQWYQQYKDRPLERVLSDFHGVRDQTIRRVNAFSDKDLTDPNRFPWLDENPLWKWIAIDSYEHEVEHAAQIQTWRDLK